MNSLYDDFGINKRKRKISYCNMNIIPQLKELKIDWDMDIDRIIFAGRRFAMGTIDDGRAEKFIETLIEKNGQSKLDIWGAFDF